MSSRRQPDCLFLLPTPVSYRSGWLDYVRHESDLEIAELYLNDGQVDRSWERAPAGHGIHYTKTLRLGSTKSGFHPRIALRICRDLDRIDPRFVVVSGWAHPATWQTARWCRSRGRPFGIMFESWQAAHRTLAPSRLANAVRSRMLGSAAVALPVSRRAASAAAGLGCEHVHLLHADTCDSDAIASHSMSIRTDRAGVLFVGRLMPHKGGNLIPAIASRLRLDGLELTVIGDGPMMDELRGAARDLDNLAIVGARQPEEARDAMARARVVVVPSFEEPWGVVLHEALASGTPVVATDRVGSVDDFRVAAAGALRVVPCSANEIADAVRSLSIASGPDLERQCRLAGSSISYETATAQLKAVLTSTEG